MSSLQEDRVTLPRGPLGPALEYWLDAGQRALLFWDVMRERGDAFLAHEAMTVPHVLDYDAELVVGGGSLDRPVNYGLVRIIPPERIAVDPQRRPFVVIDPRAGHGPGIGGFKADSEVGFAMRAGHPCYFIGFLPNPVPGQTIEDVARAEAIFLEKVISLHPDADAKPCVIGNCQAGWAVAIVAALRPELFGPVILAGAPMSYWAGVRGRNPMRYSGGLLGGSWLTALTSDLGGGIFDGSWLVQNFENLNPSNTLWTKQYNVYANVDTEAPRYLEFERWWGGHVTLNAAEMQFIVDELFVGNNLAAGRVRMSDGDEVDLRNIRSPIVVFCSKGDNITPPQQALGWILDLYEDVNEIRSYGQTIVYTVHESIGHLGIFVSGAVARKQHSELSSNIDLIDLLPPGLYEATFTPRTPDVANADLASGDWIMHCEQRTLDDIRAMGGNSPEDERRFATAARVSEINLALYRAFVQPWVRGMVRADAAALARKLQPARLQYSLLSHQNPFMALVAQGAALARENRLPAAPGNPFLAIQEALSQQIVAALDAFRDMRDGLGEAIFLTTYGSPWLQAAVGIQRDATGLRKPGRSVLHREFVKERIARLKAGMTRGGLRECVVRGLLYAAMPRGAVDERGLEALRRVRLRDDVALRPSLGEFKALAREQFFMLLIDPEAAMAAIPQLLPGDPQQRRRGLAAIINVLGAVGGTSGEVAERLHRVAELFGLPEPAPPAVIALAPSGERARVS